MSHISIQEKVTSKRERSSKVLQNETYRKKKALIRKYCHEKVPEFVPEDCENVCSLLTHSRREHPGEGDSRSVTQEADPQPQEHQLVQTALGLLGLVQVLH